MSDEFDDEPERQTRHAARSGKDADNNVTERKAELVAEIYAQGTQQLRARMLECLLRPIGPLGLVAVAAGAFGKYLSRAGQGGISVGIEDATSISQDQVFELARYVDQCSPDSFAQIASLVAEHPAGAAGIGAALAIAAMHAWRHRGANSVARRRRDDS